jgi:glycerophosphoryl diester phosphodiesterase
MCSRKTASTSCCGPGTNTAERYYNGGKASVLNNGGDSLALWTARDRLEDLFAN